MKAPPNEQYENRQFLARSAATDRWIAHGRAEERKAIRRAIAKPLRELRAVGFGKIGWKADPVKMQAAIRAIDAATRAPKRKATK